MHSLVVFNGSMRKGQYTEHVTRLVKEVADATKRFDVQIVDPRDLDLAFDDEGQAASPDSLTSMVKTADAYVIVSPEYNHGYPGSLKYVLDLNLKEYIHKPVGLVGVSSGQFGGVRVIEALLSVVRELGMVATFTDVQFTHVQDEIKNGVVSNRENWVRRVERMLTELEWMSTTLAWGRKTVPSRYHGGDDE